MDEARFVAWLKKPGEPVKTGEPLFSVETDKAIQEIEALDSGILHLLPNGPQEGDTIKIGEVIGHLLPPGETAPTPGVAKPTSAPTAESKPMTVAPKPTAPVTSGRPVSPRAARRAVATGVDLRSVTGTGRGGRVREADVVAAVGKTPAAPVVTGPAVRGMRRTIAERMMRSKSETAPVTLTTRVDATALVKLRAKFKVAAVEPAPGYNDMLMKLLAATLREHSALNAQWDGEQIRHPDAINIGLAVDTDDGLLVPVVRDVPSLTLRQVAERSAALVARVRARKSGADDLRGGTFTITNLGAMGVDAFTPIINFPECAVLGVGRIVREPVVVDETVVIQDRLWLSLTFDHRIVDGGPAARFLDDLRRAVENPPALLMEES
jgi:pyruvate dehydrogenase E2 component (dihydrolipoamide acetyltransferase)